MTVPLPIVRPGGTPGLRAERTGFATLIFGVLFFGDPLRSSINWAGWAVVCALAGAWAIAILIRTPPRPSRSPALLGALILWMIASLIWSHYRGGSLLGIGTQLVTTAGAAAVAVTVSWAGIVTALGRVLRAMVVLSLLFELFVAVFVRQPFCPVYVGCTGSHPAAFYWTRDALFTGGQIQGLPGNSNLLAIFALLALVVTAVQAHGRVIPRRTAWIGIVSAVLALGLTRSSTVIACTVVAAIVFGFAVLARRIRLGRRWLVAVLAVVVAGLVAAGIATGWGLILRVLDKSPDLTGRATIWKSVYELAVQHPVLGWGWTGWWQPYLEPFKGLAVRNGVQYLQAHDAYLDVWFQLGWIGLALFVAVLVTTTARTWWWATDRRMLGAGRPAPWNTLDLLPLLLMTILLVHGLAESRLNVEWGWALLVVVCMATRRDHLRWWTTPDGEPVDDLAATPGAARASAPTA